MSTLAYQLARTFLETHPVEAAKVLETLTPEMNAALLKEQTPERSRAILQEMLHHTAARCLEAMESHQAAAIIGDWKPNRAAQYCRHLHPDTFTALLAHIPQEQANLLQRLLKYPENTAGALMDPNIFAFRETSSVKRAWDQIHKRPQSIFYYLYVIDKSKKLAGVLNIRELAEANPEQKLSMLMNSGVDCLTDDASQQEILTHPGWKKFHALPVIDDHQEFLGIIRYENLRILEEQTIQSGGRTSIEAGSALGELYGLGLSMFLGGTGLDKPPRPSTK